jgi:F-box protein 21
MSWPWLPLEIYAQIFYFLPPSRDSDVSVRALASCIRTGTSTLKAAAMDPVLWEAHYRERYTHSDLTVEAARRAVKNENWYKMYILRRGFDRQALRLLDEIVRFKGGVTGRHRRAEEIVKSFS